MEAVERPLGVRLHLASQDFFHWASSAGLVLVLATLAALVFANVGFHDLYEEIRETLVGLSFGARTFRLPLEAWINDGLMALFFLLVGIEIKREIVAGELSDLSRAALPLVGALGGMLVPALVYAAFNAGTPSAAGWGVPMATDIAFTLGLMAVLGRRVPATLTVFVSALAIADDLGAILVIALFYSAGHRARAARRRRGRDAGDARPQPRARLLPDAVPLARRRAVGARPRVRLARDARGRADGGRHPVAAQRQPLRRRGAGGGPCSRPRRRTPRSPAPKTPRSGRARCACFEMPWTGSASRATTCSTRSRTGPASSSCRCFAFFNTGLLLFGSGFSAAAPESLGVILALVVGKPLGIVGLCWLAVKLGVAKLSSEVSWAQMVGAGCLCGVGFTMSIFIATSAFAGPQLEAVKIAVLIASAVSAALGMTLLVRATRPEALAAGE